MGTIEPEPEPERMDAPFRVSVEEPRALGTELPHHVDFAAPNTGTANGGQPSMNLLQSVGPRTPRQMPLKLNAADFTICDLREPIASPTESDLLNDTNNFKSSPSKESAIPCAKHVASCTLRPAGDGGHRDGMRLFEDIADLLRREHNTVQELLSVHLSKQVTIFEDMADSFRTENNRLKQRMGAQCLKQETLIQQVLRCPVTVASKTKRFTTSFAPTQNVQDQTDKTFTTSFAPTQNVQGWRNSSFASASLSQVAAKIAQPSAAFCNINSTGNDLHMSDCPPGGQKPSVEALDIRTTTSRISSPSGDRRTSRISSPSGGVLDVATRRRAQTQAFSTQIRLGLTSAERAKREYSDQFVRLADWKGEKLKVGRVSEVVNAYSESPEAISIEELAEAMLAFNYLDEDDILDGKKNVYLDVDSFVTLMLALEIPADVETTVMYIQEAFQAEQLAHQDRLQWMASKWRRNRGAYDNISMTADILGAAVILLNGLMLGVNSDIASDHSTWRVTEYIFLGFFILEFAFHMSRNGWRKHFFGPDWRWNLFDVVLISCATFDACLSAMTANDVEGGPLQLISRTLRLARLSRLVRLLRFKVFTELKQLIFGVVAGLRVLSWAILLLVVFIYVVSLVMRQTIGADLESEFASQFQNVPWTMFTVFRCLTDGCTAPDGTPLQVFLYRRYGTGFMIIYCIVFLFVSIGIFNLIMATFIDSVMMVSAARNRIDRANNAEKLKLKLTSVVVSFWKGDSNDPARPVSFNGLRRQSERCMDDKAFWMSELKDVRVTRDLLNTWMCQPQMIHILEELDIQVADNSSLFDALDCDLSGEIEGFELINGLMALRGPTEKIDVVTTLVAVKYILAMLIRIEASVCPDNTGISLAMTDPRMPSFLKGPRSMTSRATQPAASAV